MPRLQAKRLRREWSYRATPTGKTIYGLVLAETGDVEQARRAETEFLRAQLRAGQKPEVEP